MHIKFRYFVGDIILKHFFQRKSNIRCFLRMNVNFKLGHILLYFDDYMYAALQL